MVVGFVAVFHLFTDGAIDGVGLRRRKLHPLAPGEQVNQAAMLLEHGPPLSLAGVSREDELDGQ